MWKTLQDTDFWMTLRNETYKPWTNWTERSKRYTMQRSKVQGSDKKDQTATSRTMTKTESIVVKATESITKKRAETEKH